MHCILLLGSITFNMRSLCTERRFLAAAEELEENTTYTNADGAECIIPATRSAAFPEQANSNSGSASSSGNLAGEEAALTSEGNRFIEKYVH
jgi:hypothetical protein